MTSGLSKHQMFGDQLGFHMSENLCLISEDHDCRVSRAIYQIACGNCKENPAAKDALYIGTTGRTVHSRQLEHQSAVRLGTESNPLVKHHSVNHPGINPNFHTGILHGGIRFNLDRFVVEALEIDSAREDQNVIVLNQKAEWGQQSLPRLAVRNDR